MIIMLFTDLSATLMHVIKLLQTNTTLGFWNTYLARELFLQGQGIHIVSQTTDQSDDGQC